MSKPFWEVRNATNDVAEVFIYDAIGEDLWGTGVTAKAFIEEIGNIKASRIDLHLNSPGGSVFDGQAIYNALVRHPAQVTTYIDGLAASIASVIALAGDRVVMASNALFMIHNPMSSVAGYASDMRKMADVLDKIKDSIVNVYLEKTTLSADEVHSAMDEETWYTAQEAVQAGFASEMSAALPVAAHFDLTAFNFKHTPAVTNDWPGEEYRGEPAEEADTPQVSDEAGAADSVHSDGASEDIQPEEVEIRDETFVAGIGFVTFNRKR
jgi:ATP-dependent Clp endopeptidase proteolytic subunit ClpP